MVVVLREEAESDGCHGVVAPTQVERLEQTPILLCIEKEGGRRKKRERERERERVKSHVRSL